MPKPQPKTLLSREPTVVGSCSWAFGQNSSAPVHTDYGPRWREKPTLQTANMLLDFDGAAAAFFFTGATQNRVEVCGQPRSPDLISFPTEALVV